MFLNKIVNKLFQIFFLNQRLRFYNACEEKLFNFTKLLNKAIKDIENEFKQISKKKTYNNNKCLKDNAHIETHTLMMIIYTCDIINILYTCIHL